MYPRGWNRLHERCESIFGTASARAAMARSSESQSDESTDKSLRGMDCGASVTITGSHLYCVDVKEHKTTIARAKEGEFIVATHACRKTSFVKNRVGDMVYITTYVMSPEKTAPPAEQAWGTWPLGGECFRNMLSMWGWQVYQLY